MDAAAVSKAEDEERERKREAIRKRIEEARSLQSRQAQEQVAQQPAVPAMAATTQTEVDFAQRPVQSQAGKESSSEESDEEYEDDRPAGRESGTATDVFSNSYFEEQLPLPLDEAGSYLATIAMHSLDLSQRRIHDFNCSAVYGLGRL